MDTNTTENFLKNCYQSTNIHDQKVISEHIGEKEQKFKRLEKVINQTFIRLQCTISLLLND